MTSHIRRSASSVAANIAEGFGRESQPQFAQFLRVAQGSLKELETHLIISQRVGLLADDLTDELLKQCNELGKMMRAFMKSVQQNA